MTQFQGDTAALKALASDRQNTRLLRIRFPKDDAPAGALMLANTLEADEGMARDYVWTVGVLSDSANVRPEDVLGKMVCIELVREDGTLRFFNGYVTGFRFVRTDGGFAFYEITLGPWMAFLRLRQDNLAFHDLNGLGITGKVLDQYLRRDWRHRLTTEDAAVTYTCQYGESDHNFLHRQWEARGWYYTYEHRADGHTLILADDSSRTATPIDGARSDMPFQDQAGTMEDDGIQRWSPAQRVCSERTTLASFNFKHPLPKRVERSAAAVGAADSIAEVYENTGMYGFRDFNDGEALSQLRIEEIESRRSEYTATGNDRCAEPGRWFTLSGYFSGSGASAAAEQKYLITSVRHYATNNYQDGSGAVSRYSNEISCIAQDIPWRPGRGFHSFEPRIYGVQTAVVVGPPGEEIHTDGYGRVKVQFHWDRRGEFNDRSSPWVRVVSGWAGAQFGQISVPRVGMEVVVQFLDGNINRPLVTGCVYNENNMPPWELPGNKTQSGILTRSSVVGKPAHANALRFEDKRGAEEVWLHAEKDQRLEVEHDEAHWVGNDRSKTVDRDERVCVKRDRTEDVMQDEVITVGRNRTERVGRNEKLTVRGNKSERVILAKEESIGLGKALSVGGVYQVSVVSAMNTSVGMSQTAQVGSSKHTRVGRSFTIDAGDEFSVKVGASIFQMRSDGSILIAGTRIGIESSGPVTINGKDVDINPGGGGKSTGSGTSGVRAAAAPEISSEDVPTDTDEPVLREDEGVLRRAEVPAGAGAHRTAIAAGTSDATVSRPAVTKWADIESVASVAAAPEKIAFSEEMQKQFDVLWGKSLPDGKPLEHGGTLVASLRDGTLTMVNQSSGTDKNFTPNYDVGLNQRVAGIFHTHPYSEEEGGGTGSLSAGDAVVAATSAQGLTIAQSGEEQFAFLRTKSTLSSVNYKQAIQLGDQRVQELTSTGGMDFSAATKQAAREIADHLHLAYYEGRNGVLVKVNGSRP
jgi:type VI secretion system secreted protein VgrG